MSLLRFLFGAIYRPFGPSPYGSPSDGDPQPLTVDGDGNLNTTINGSVTTTSASGDQARPLDFYYGATPEGVDLLFPVFDDTEFQSRAGQYGAKHVQLRDETTGEEVGVAAKPLRIDPTGSTAQPVTDNGGSLTVDGTVTANAGSGTFTTDQANAAEADYDTGAGTVNQVMFGLALPASGGPVAGGSTTNPIAVQGTVAQGAAISGNAVPIGGRLTSGNRADAYFATQDTDGDTDVQYYGLVTSSLMLALEDGSGTHHLERWRNNVAKTLLSSAARTADTNSSDQTNYNARGAMFFVNVTATSATPSVTLNVQGKDPVSGNYFTIYTSAAFTATGQFSYQVYPGASAAGALTGAAPLTIPRTWRVFMDHADADSITYSVGMSYIV